MSGVYIKGMEIAEHCIDCPFMVSRDNDDCILQSEEANANFGSWDDMRKGCPLIPVPDHGRLIDANALKENWFITELGNKVVEVQEIDAAPTIIPASKGGA